MPMQLVVFTLELQNYALPLARVQRVVRMMEVTSLPEAPGIVLGVIDLQGKIIPVMSMRKRFGLSEPEASLVDQLIVADTGTRSIALLVNSVSGVIERTAEEITATEEIVPGVQHVEGISRLDDGILFICNLDRFLSTKEERELNGLLAQGAGKSAGRG
jgi:purine-binding chemotaxis protein CheW